MDHAGSALMTGRLQRYVAFWNEREAPDALALLRISFGTAMVLNVVEQLWRGNVLETFASVPHGGVFASSPNVTWSIFHFAEPTASQVWTLVFTQLLAAMCVALGLFTRPAAVVVWVIQCTLYDRMVFFRFDGDNVFRIASYLLMLAPTNAAWSLDARWFGARQHDVPLWPRRLFMAQLAIIYTRTGLVKLASTWSFMGGWQALYLALNLPGIARWPGDWAAWVFPLTQVGTFVSKWFEVLFFLVPLNVYLRARPHAGRGRVLSLLARWDLRRPFLLTGVLMHTGILLFMEVGLFSVVMVSLYVSYLHPPEARRVLARLEGLFRHALSRGSRA